MKGTEPVRETPFLRQETKKRCKLSTSVPQLPYFKYRVLDRPISTSGSHDSEIPIVVFQWDSGNQPSNSPLQNQVQTAVGNAIFATQILSSLFIKSHPMLRAKFTRTTIKGSLTIQASISPQENARKEVTRRIKDLGSKGKIKLAVNEVAQAARLGISLDTQMATTLIDVCVRNKKLELAETLFNDLFGEFVSPDDITFCTLIRGFGSLDEFDWSNIKRILDRMRYEFEIQPNINVYNALLEVCVVQNDVDQAEAFIDQMLAEEIVPNDLTLKTVRQRRCIRKLVKQLDREMSQNRN